MEIREVVSYHFNNVTENLEINFKTIDDDDSVFRVDKIEFNEIDSFGFTFHKDSSDFFDEEENDDDLDLFGDDGYDEEELKSFLNEYYLVFPERLPDIEY